MGQEIGLVITQKKILLRFANHIPSSRHTLGMREIIALLEFETFEFKWSPQSEAKDFIELASIQVQAWSPCPLEWVVTRIVIDI